VSKRVGMDFKVQGAPLFYSNLTNLRGKLRSFPLVLPHHGEAKTPLAHGSAHKLSSETPRRKKTPKHSVVFSVNKIFARVCLLHLA